MMSDMKVWGPAKADDSVVTSKKPCPMCGMNFAVGHRYVLVSIGPDPHDDSAIRSYLTNIGAYNAVAKCIHETCLRDVHPTLRGE